MQSFSRGILIPYYRSLPADIVTDNSFNKVRAVVPVTVVLPAHLVYGHSLSHVFYHFLDTERGQVLEYYPVDDGCRLLVTHPDTRGIVQPYQPVTAHIAKFNACFLFKGLLYFLPSHHLGGHTVIQVDIIFPQRFIAEEVVKTDRLDQLGLRDSNLVRDLLVDFLRDISYFFLYIQQDIHQAGWIIAVSVNNVGNACFHKKEYLICYWLLLIIFCPFLLNLFTK